MINDMDLALPAIKYVDDTTMYETLKHPLPYQKKKGMLAPVSSLDEAATNESTQKPKLWNCSFVSVLTLTSLQISQ